MDLRIATAYRSQLPNGFIPELLCCAYLLSYKPAKCFPRLFGGSRTVANWHAMLWLRHQARMSRSVVICTDTDVSLTLALRLSDGLSRTLRQNRRICCR